jgi:hypothetical protein
VIHIGSPFDALEPAERFGLRVLLDQSRLLPVDDPAAPVVHLELDRDSGGDVSDPAALAEPLSGGPGLVRVSRRQLGAIGRLVAGAAEQGSVLADRHGRVPASENPLVQCGGFGDPVVTRFAMTFRIEVIRQAEARPVRLTAPWPQGRRWAACLTSDLDVVVGWPAAALLRLGELVSHGQPGTALRGGIASLSAIGREPVHRAVERQLTALARHSMRTTWFVMAGSPSIRSRLQGDITYRLESRAARRIVESVVGAGHEIGLHGSFATMTDSDRFRSERERLASLIGQEVHGVRQHYLRMRPGLTQAAMAGAGFHYDASFGYADRNGFRLASADSAPGWQVAGGRENGLEEVPLVWMDRALSKYQRIEDPERWVDEALELAARCRDVGGVWVGLWHPNQATELGFPGAEPALDRLLSSLAGDRPYLGTLGEIVKWRRLRRSVRATTVLADGTPMLRIGHEVPIEDPQARPVVARAAAGTA